MPAIESNTFTWTAAGTTSDATDLKLTDHLSSLIGLVIPSVFTGASISFQVSVDDSTYQALYDSSNSLVSITVSASRTYGFTDAVRAALAYWRFVKIVSASSEASGRTVVAYTK